MVGHWPFSGFWLSKSNLLGQIYYTFSIGKPIIVYKNVPTFSEWPTISTPYFKLWDVRVVIVVLFQAMPDHQILMT